MKPYIVKIRPTAEADIQARFLQIQVESPTNAKRWYQQLIAAIKSLEILALRCPVAEEDVEFGIGIRQLMVGRYRVLYFINKDAVEILHIRHVRHARKL